MNKNSFNWTKTLHMETFKPRWEFLLLIPFRIGRHFMFSLIEQILEQLRTKKFIWQ